MPPSGKPIGVPKWDVFWFKFCCRCSYCEQRRLHEFESADPRVAGLYNFYDWIGMAPRECEGVARFLKWGRDGRRA